MLPPTDFPTNVNAQYPSTFGPDAGIITVPGIPNRWPCYNDCETYGGTCRSYEKVSKQYALCSNCIVSSFPVYDGLFENSVAD